MDSGAPALTLEERRRTIEEEIENEIEEGGIEDEGGARKEEEDGAGIESIPVISTPAVAAREGEGAERPGWGGGAARAPLGCVVGESAGHCAVTCRVVMAFALDHVCVF